MFKKIAVAFVLALTCIALTLGYSVAYAEDAQPVDVYITFDYRPQNASKHIQPKTKSELVAPFTLDVWASLPISVTDASGAVTQVSSTTGPGDNDVMRYAGKFKPGEVIIFKLKTASLPEGWCPSIVYNTPFKKWEGFEFRYTVPTADKAVSNPAKIGFGFLDVVFDPNGGTFNGSTEPIVQRVHRNNTVVLPEEPTRENMQFLYWYTLSSKGQEFTWDETDGYSDTSNDMLAYNDEKFDPRGDARFILRAFWGHRVTINFGNGQDNLIKDVKPGDKVAKPEDPTFEGWKFEGWVLEDGTPFDFETTAISSNVTVFAKWSGERDVAYKTVRKPDDSMYKGTERVVTEGVNGRTATTKIGDTFIDGDLISAPVDEVIAYGTKENEPGDGNNQQVVRTIRVVRKSHSGIPAAGDISFGSSVAVLLGILGVVASRKLR